MENGKTAELRREWTERFLAAFELGKRLLAEEPGTDGVVGKSTPEEDAAARAECARLVRPFDAGVEAGQVRLLWGIDSIAYALVVRKWDESSWLVLPFSPFSVPATDTELKARTDGGLGLRVLELWNAFSLETETVEKSWLVHTLSADETRDALDAWRWTVGVGELTEEQLARTGLPITNRRDPRVEYRKGEIAKFAKYLAEDFALGERKAWVASVREMLAGRTAAPFRRAAAFGKDLALAAAGVTEAVSADCEVAGFEGKVHVRYNPEEKVLSIRVFGADGEYSEALGGWGVFGKDAEWLGVIDGSSFRHAFTDAFDGILAIADPDGEAQPLLSDEPEK